MKKWIYIDQSNKQNGVYTTKQMRNILNKSELPFFNRTKIKNIYWEKLDLFLPLYFVYEKYEKAFKYEVNENELTIKYKNYYMEMTLNIK